MLFTSKSSSAPSSLASSAAWARPSRYLLSRSKSTRCSKSTPIGPGAGIGRLSARTGLCMRGNVLLKSIAVSPSILGKMTMASRSQFIAGTAAATIAGGLARPARADQRTVRVAYFPGVSALPLLIAVRAGFFAREGLDVNATPTTSSPDLFGKLDTGALDIGHTSIDNPIAYDVGAGAVKLVNR